MKALWIRVEAHEVDSVRIEKLAEALDVDVVTALGHYVALGGAIAEHSPEGIIGDISDLKLERWAHWGGRRGVFAKAVRAQLQDEEGEFSDWQDSMGKLVERRAADRERQEARRRELRADRERRKAESAAKTSADKPPSVRGLSTDNPGNVRGQSAEKGQKSSATERTVRTKRTVTADSGMERGPESAPAPASLRSDRQLPSTLPADCQRFLDRFYPVVGDRRADVELQLKKLAAGHPVRDGKNQDVRAYSADRLAEKCLEVIAESRLIRDLDKAIVVLFTKLGDTSDGSAPGQREAEQLQAVDADEHAIDNWIREHPAEVAALRSAAVSSWRTLHDRAPSDFDFLAIDAEVRSRVRDRLFAHAAEPIGAERPRGADDGLTDSDRRDP